MKTLKKLFIFVAIILSISVVTNSIAGVSQLAYAKEALVEDGGGGSEDAAESDGGASKNYGCRPFLGMTSWDCGLEPEKAWQGNENITKSIWIIVANVSNDLVVIAAYLILGFIIYGGYLYMFATGDVGKTSAGKKTLVNASIGLAIVMSAKIFINSLQIALLGSSGGFRSDCANAECADANTFVTNLIQWVIGIAGLVAVIFIVVGAISYITSAGDASKLQKAKNTIIYALVGLAIVGLAEIITALVSSTVRNATNDSTSYNNTLTIAKELSHEN